VPLFPEFRQVLNDALLLCGRESQKDREINNLDIQRRVFQIDEPLKGRWLCQNGYRQINKKVVTVRRLF
jgi:hypothetical protein